VTSCLGQQFGDDNQSGDWLPIPDEFVWPKVVDDTPKFIPTVKSFTQLSKLQRKTIKGFWPESSAPKEVNIFEVDLNADQKAELFVAIPSYSGTGGTFYEIFSPTVSGTYESIGEVQGWGFQFLELASGWLKIEGMSRGGGGNYTRYLMKFLGNTYTIIRNEDHDFNTGKVTIR